jgi:hypothetical protein
MLSMMIGACEEAYEGARVDIQSLVSMKKCRWKIGLKRPMDQ